MLIEYFKPSFSLNKIIKTYYLIEGDFGNRTQDTFYADGCIEIVFNLDVQFYRKNVKEEWAKVIGQIVKPLEVEAKGKGKSFGIWFYPQGFSMLSGIPANELTEVAIPLDKIFDRYFVDFVGELLMNNKIIYLIRALNNFFEGILDNKKLNFKDIVAQQAIIKSYSSENWNLDELASDLNISNRYLQKIFLEKVGLRPKQYQRILRFQRALSQINMNSKNSLTLTAYDINYYDQSHFIREFKGFTGLVPSKFNSDNHHINRLFLIS